MNTSYEDLLALLRDIEEKYPPREMIKAILITKTQSWFIPRGICFKVEYEGDNYYLLHGLDFKQILDAVTTYSATSIVERDLPFGSLGHLRGIPVIEDEEKIRKILAEKFSEISFRTKTHPWEFMDFSDRSEDE